MQRHASVMQSENLLPKVLSILLLYLGDLYMKTLMSKSDTAVRLNALGLGRSLPLESKVGKSGEQLRMN